MAGAPLRKLHKSRFICVIVANDEDILVHAVRIQGLEHDMLISKDVWCLGDREAKTASSVCAQRDR